VSNVLQALRKATEQNIAENPVTVVIRRKVYVQNASGGRTEQTRALPPFQGRLVTTKQLPRVYQPEAGMHQAVSGWALIAPHDADLRWGSDVVDEFKLVDGRSYRVVRVIPRGYNGEIYAVHALLEEVA